MHQVNLRIAQMMGHQHILGALLGRGFFGRLKWLLIGK